jgi:hypothetical protein
MEMQMGMVFCWGCGKEIHAEATTCPSCGAPQRGTNFETKKATYLTYSQVPWCRKSWFILLAFLLFAPATLYSLFSGDIYYEKNGQLVTYSKPVKIITIVLCLMSSLWFLGKLLGLE